MSLSAESLSAASREGRNLFEEICLGQFASLIESRISFNFCAGLRGWRFLVVLGVSVVNVGLRGVSMLDESLLS